MLSKYPFSLPKAFWINPRLASGDCKTRLRLKHLQSLVLRFARIYFSKTLSMAAQTDLFGQQAGKDLAFG